MTLLAPPYEPLPGRALFVVPHPDDEVGCGAALLAHARAGAPIDVLQVFDGALGNEDGVARAELALRREAERSSLQVLAPEASPTLISWGLPEGHAPTSADLESGRGAAGAADSDAAPRDAVRSLGGTPIPTITRSPPPSRRRDALGPEAPRAVAYEVWSDLEPDWVVTPETGDWATLERALACHGSQGGESELRAALRERGRRRALSPVRPSARPSPASPDARSSGGPREDRGGRLAPPSGCGGWDRAGRGHPGAGAACPRARRPPPGRATCGRGRDPAPPSSPRLATVLLGSDPDEAPDPLGQLACCNAC